jgi:hypothetical protein
MRLGFSGSQRGMAEAQEEFFRFALRRLRKLPEGVQEFHHGDAIGADAQADRACRELAIPVVIHPPAITTKRAFCQRPGDLVHPPQPYLERNHAIVDSCELLIACPGEAFEVLRSGTWATIRYARKIGRRRLLIFPDGRFVGERDLVGAMTGSLPE